MKAEEADLAESPSIFIHSPVLCDRTYLPLIYMTDWFVAYYEVSFGVFCWLVTLITVGFGGIAFGVIYDDFAGYILSITILIGIALMTFAGTPYNGACKVMSLPHLFNIIAVIYNILRLSIDLGCDSSFFCPQITYNNKRGLFIYLMVMVIQWGICMILDFVDVYTWFIKGDQEVWRTKKSLDKLKSIKVLHDNVGAVQVIHKNWQRPESIDKYGYIVRKSNTEETNLLDM